jgi:hypothetical protein
MGIDIKLNPLRAHTSYMSLQPQNIHESDQQSTRSGRESIYG